MTSSPDPAGADRATLIATAQRAASSLAQSVVDKDDATPIETNVATLRNLAAVIAQLADDAQRCAGPECFGRSDGGIKTWVTRDWAAIQSSRAERYAAALQAIANAGTGQDEALAMLVDWPSIARQMASCAQEALTSGQHA